MELDADVRWNLKVSRETDLSLRTFLGARGMKKGDLSKFVEEAVRWRIFDRTVQEIKARNADTDPEELQELIDATIREVRPHEDWLAKRPRASEAGIARALGILSRDRAVAPAGEDRLPAEARPARRQGGAE